MPSGLFKQVDNQWVFSGPTPPTFNGYQGDHRKLLTDYIFQLTPEEQRRVAASMPHAKTASSSLGVITSRPPHERITPAVEVRDRIPWLEFPDTDSSSGRQIRSGLVEMTDKRTCKPRKGRHHESKVGKELFLSMLALCALLALGSM